MSNDSTIPTPATPDVCTVAILVDGKAISGEFHVLSLSVTRELNRIPTATIQLRDGEAAKSTFLASNSDHFIPGKEIEIQLGYRSSNESVFKGIVVKHGIRIRKDGSVLNLECRDKAVKMSSGVKSRYFVDQKDSDIMETIISSHQLQKEVTPTKPDLKELTQYDCSDWDFLICRAEANGQVVIVEDGKVTVTPPATGGEPVVTVRYGATLLELDAEIDARRQSKAIRTSSWSPSEQELLDADAKEPPKAAAGNLTPNQLAEVLGGAEHAIRHGGKLTQPELQAWADATLLRERLARVRGRARFQGFAGVRPGKIIEVTGIGERFEGKLYVSGVKQTFVKGNWETDVQFGLNSDRFAETFNLRPLPASGLIPAVSGLQIGVVTALQNDPEGQHRIKVRLPVVSKVAEGIWARVATLDAGNNRGTFFRPEIGNEVIVGFLDDDPCHPVVLGMCHSSANPAPEAAQDTNHRKGYVSRSKMRFTFDDQKKSVVLETDAGNRLQLSEAEKGIMLTDQNGNKIIMDNKGIKIESSKDLTIKAAKDIKIEGNRIEINAQSTLKMAAAASAELSGASMTVKGSASTVVQGGIVRIN